MSDRDSHLEAGKRRVEAMSDRELEQPQRPATTDCPPWCTGRHAGDSPVLVHDSVNFAAEPSGRFMVTVWQRETFFRGHHHRDYPTIAFGLSGTDVVLVLNAAQARMFADAIDAMPAARFLSDGLRKAAETLEQHTTPDQ
jgi:hypothetical protein